MSLEHDDRQQPVWKKFVEWYLVQYQALQRIFNKRLRDSTAPATTLLKEPPEEVFVEHTEKIKAPEPVLTFTDAAAWLQNHEHEALLSWGLYTLHMPYVLRQFSNASIVLWDMHLYTESTLEKLLEYSVSPFLKHWDKTYKSLIVTQMTSREREYFGELLQNGLAHCPTPCRTADAFAHYFETIEKIHLFYENGTAITYKKQRKQ